LERPGRAVNTSAVGIDLRGTDAEGTQQLRGRHVDRSVPATAPVRCAVLIDAEVGVRRLERKSVARRGRRRCALRTRREHGAGLADGSDFFCTTLPLTVRAELTTEPAGGGA
jgi:hypothetical protein